MMGMSMTIINLDAVFVLAI